MEQDNLSWNCGWEGPTDNPGIEALRERKIRNAYMLTLLSVGVPLVLMGDEVRRTQEATTTPTARIIVLAGSTGSCAERTSASIASLRC